MPSYIKEAEKNILKVAKEMTMMLDVLDALTGFGNIACHEHIGKKEYFDGLSTMKKAIYNYISMRYIIVFSLSE